MLGMLGLLGMLGMLPIFLLISQSRRGLKIKFYQNSHYVGIGMVHDPSSISLTKNIHFFSESLWSAYRKLRLHTILGD